MAGISNGTLYGNNVDFTGNTIPSPQVLLDGQLLIGSAVAPKIRVATLTAGAGVSIVNGHGTITISATSGTFNWSAISADQTLAIDNGYSCVSPGGDLLLTLPAVSPVGSIIEVTLDGATSFEIVQRAGQSIRIGNLSSTAGVTGSLTSTQQGDAIRMVCTVANLKWNVLSSMGNPTVV